MKILLAEDEPISRLLMRRTLEQFGYDVIVAEDGRQAAEILFSPARPRLALVDWMMPELDGPDLCRKLREQPEAPYVYVILLTSKQTSEDVVVGLSSGADDFLRKPCAPAELQARLRSGRRILELEDKLVAAREQMRYKATYDSLTGLLNRAAILSFAREALRRSSRTGVAPVLLLCDVDRFKKINDSYGHLTGDVVLQEVGLRLSNAVRSGDAVGRYGGEEFLVVLSGCPEGAVERRTEQIRQSVAATPIRVEGLDLWVTMSAGCIVCNYFSDDSDLQRTLASADAALYRAKIGGRNRVEFVDTLAIA